jgi:addiction module HigA family antidote
MSDAPDFRMQAKRLIDSLPDGAGWEELAYEVYVRQSIEQGLADLAAGRTVDHETVMAEATRRLQELKDGVVEGVPAGEVFKSVKERLSTESQHTTTMAIPNTRKRNRRPTHPGALLREEFLPDLQLSAAELADKLGLSRRSVRELLRERRAIRAETALRLGRLLGMSPEMWLELQSAVDLWDARQRIKPELAKIRPVQAA